MTKSCSGMSLVYSQSSKKASNCGGRQRNRSLGSRSQLEEGEEKPVKDSVAREGSAI